MVEQSMSNEKKWKKMKGFWIDHEANKKYNKSDSGVRQCECRNNGGAFYGCDYDDVYTIDLIDDKYTYIHTYTHTCIRTHIHTYIQTNIHTYIKTQVIGLCVHKNFQRKKL